MKFVDLYKVVREAIRVSEPAYSLKNLETFYMEKRTGTVRNRRGQHRRLQSLAGNGCGGTAPGNCLLQRDRLHFHRQASRLVADLPAQRRGLV